MDPSFIVIGVAVGAGLAIASLLQRRKNQAQGNLILPLLRERGPMTLPELGAAMNQPGFMARGKIAMALNEMVAARQIEVIPAPDGTPALQKIDHIKYRILEG
jgi:hypothetical protein